MTVAIPPRERNTLVGCSSGVAVGRGAALQSVAVLHRVKPLTCDFPSSLPYHATATHTLSLPPSPSPPSGDRRTAAAGCEWRVRTRLSAGAVCCTPRMCLCLRTPPRPAWQSSSWTKHGAEGLRAGRRREGQRGGLLDKASLAKFLMDKTWCGGRAGAGGCYVQGGGGEGRE